MLTGFPDLLDCEAADSVKHKIPGTMELLYVWIEDYKNIKKQGFNFSPKHWFDYNDKTNTLTHEKRNSNYPENFFGEHISNVTAIVGKNGSGKSSLISRILNSIRYPHETEGRYFLLLKNNSNEIKVHNVGIDLNTKLPSLFEEYLGNPKWSQKNTNLIYYSNDLLYGPLIIEDKKFSYSTDTINILEKDIYDVSTNTLLQKNQTTGKYKSAALLNICNFFNEYEVVSNKIRLPEYFVAELPELNFDQLRLKGLIKNLVTEERLKTQSPMFTTSEYIKQWEDFCLKLEVWMHENYNEQNFVNQIQLQLFIAFVENHHSRLEDNLDALSDCFKFSNQPIEKVPLNFFNRIKRDNNYKVIFTKRIDAILEFFNFLNKVFPNKLRAIKDTDDSTYKCYFEIKNSSDLKLLFTFINHINKIKWPESHTEDQYDNFNLFDYYFEFSLTNPSNFSSGEISLLHFLARLYHIKNIKTGKELKKNIILLIDEGDLGYHPEWQREYLNIVIMEAAKIFEDHKLQIILTTHSPFLVSDLPKDNIIFLNKNESGMCKVCNKEERPENTFGANIHSLYRNSFFLENGLMGEFAKGKIDQVIRNLNDEIANEEDKMTPKDMQFIIQQIGEPIIKNKLQEMFDHYEFELDDEIEKLETKLAELKRRKQ